MSSNTFTENVDKVVEFLEDKPASTRRHQYNSLRVFTNNDKYGLLMKKDNETYTKQMNERNRTAKQEENWISRDDINTTLATLKVKRDAIYEKVKQKVPLQMNDYQALQNYLILLLSSDQHFPIRRTMDWTNFKIKDIDIQEDNYMTDEMLVFNKYKTSKTKGIGIRCTCKSTKVRIVGRHKVLRACQYKWRCTVRWWLCSCFLL